jgi:hypothetical protein
VIQDRIVKVKTEVVVKSISSTSSAKYWLPSTS